MQGTLDERLRSIGLSAAEIVSFKELLNGAVAHRRAHWDKLRPNDQECWVLDMAELAHEVGIPRVYAGMRKAWTWNKFLASAAEVRECLPQIPDVAKPRAMHDSHCADCSGSGWKYAPVDQYGNRRVARCACNTRPHQPCTVVANAETATWIKQKVAELDAALHMPAARTPYRPKPATPSAPSAIPIVQFTADQIQQRKPAERAEIHDIEDRLTQARNGTYEKKA